MVIYFIVFVAVLTLVGALIIFYFSRKQAIKENASYVENTTAEIGKILKRRKELLGK